MRLGLLRGRPAPFASSHIIGREDKRTNNKTVRRDAKNNGAAGYQGPVKIEVLGQGAGLKTCCVHSVKSVKQGFCNRHDMRTQYKRPNTCCMDAECMKHAT